MEEKKLNELLIEMYGKQVLPIENLPQAYCPGGLANVKAIYLGCDPSNIHSTILPYVFAHESGIPIFNSFLKQHSEQLNQIELNWSIVYSQNLCRNYFKNETSKNLRLWKKVANEFWINKLIKELEIFDKNIPVLLTAQYLLEVLATSGYENICAPCFYECFVKIPVPSEFSKLGRALIPLYRGKSPKYDVPYHLKNSKWNKYKNSIIEYLFNHSS